MLRSALTLFLKTYSHQWRLYLQCQEQQNLNF